LLKNRNGISNDWGLKDKYEIMVEVKNSSQGSFASPIYSRYGMDKNKTWISAENNSPA
jgi:hypothetical protein